MSVTALELTLFRTGGVDIAQGAFAPWLPAAEREVLVPSPVWSALVRTAQGNVLFDTGLHPVHIERPEATFGPQPRMRIVMREEDRILAQLALLRLGPSDIAIVVNSHLHFDHAGNNGAFPDATFVVQREHLAYAKGRPNFPAQYWDRPELRYHQVDGEAEVAPGVRVVPTPGHAPGHQSLVVDLPETGRVVLCGDAAFTRDNLERGVVPQPDPAAGAASLARIRELVSGDLDRAFPSHDQGSWERWRHGPEAYR